MSRASPFSSHSVVITISAPGSSRTPARPAVRGPVRIFGPLQILEDGDRAPEVPRGGPDPVQHLRVVLVAAVREVEPRHVDAGGQQALQHFGVGGGGTEGGDDLGAAHGHIV